MVDMKQTDLLRTLSKKQTAELLQISVSALEKHMLADNIGYIKVGHEMQGRVRFPVFAIISFMAKNYSKPVTADALAQLIAQWSTQQ